VSLFTPLTLTAPRIAYCVIHQRQPEVPQDTYVKILTELTGQVGTRSKEATERIRSWREAQAAEAVKAAPPDVGKKVRSLLEQVSPLPAVEAGLELATTDGTFADPRLQQLAVAGREYLASLGFRTTSGEAPVHYSIVIFTGSWNYDFIEHIVRDGMGIYEYPHLNHIEQLGRVIFFTQNEVFAVGDPLETQPGEWQPSIFFAKGKPHYDEFRAGLRQAMERAAKAARLSAISLWQRKLGMGNIFEWELRLRCAADPEQLARALEAIAEAGGPVAERVASRGRLLVYQRID
jgi:hypothetical protein